MMSGPWPVQMTRPAGAPGRVSTMKPGGIRTLNASAKTVSVNVTLRQTLDLRPTQSMSERKYTTGQLLSPRI